MLRAFAGRARRRIEAGLARAVGWPGRQRSRLAGDHAAILMYHRVIPRQHAAEYGVEPGMYVSPETFATHLECLARHFDVRPLHEIVGQLAEGRSVAPRAVAITFDDGWLDNLEHALPALEKHGLPATIFAVAQRVGTLGAFWPDEVMARLSAAGAAGLHTVAEQIGLGRAETPEEILDHLKAVSERERPELIARIEPTTEPPRQPDRALLDWDELDRLSAAGVDIEVHGATHAILTSLTADEIRDELSVALSVLQGRGHARHRLLAYPSGAFDDRVVEIARELGYRGAVTTHEAIASAGDDPLALPRIGLHDDVSDHADLFLMRVPGRF